MPRDNGTEPCKIGLATRRDLGQARGSSTIDDRRRGPAERWVCPVCGTAIPYQSCLLFSLTTCHKCSAEWLGNEREAK